LSEQKEQFDIVFNDIDKQDYPRVLKVVGRRVRKGGLFITDNTLWSGKVARPADSDDTAPPAAEDAIVTATPPASDRMAQPDEADDDAINSDIALAEPVEPEAPAPEALGTDDAEAVIEEALAQESLAQESLAQEALA